MFRGMIFSSITQSGNVLFILFYRTLDILFSTVLFQKENNAQTLIYLHECKYIFHKHVSFEEFARTDNDVRLNKLRHKKSMTSN